MKKGIKRFATGAIYLAFVFAFIAAAIAALWLITSETTPWIDEGTDFVMPKKPTKME